MRLTWFVWDPLGIICVIITYILLIFAFYCYFFVFVAQVFSEILPRMSIVTFLAAWIAAAVAHARCMLTDPGALAKFTLPQAEPIIQPESRTIRCVKCYCAKIPRSHHCSVCNRCIRKMDHHCPWINNCIGHFNQKYFLLFNFYIALLGAQVICMITPFVIRCLSHETGAALNDCVSKEPGYFILILLLFIEALLFSLFSFMMLCIQIYNIFTECSTIDRVKLQRDVPSLSRIGRFEEVFGEKFNYKWFLPTSPKSFARRIHYNSLV